MADFSYSGVDIANGNAAQATITRADYNLVLQVDYDNIDDDVEVVTQQSHDNATWDNLHDENGQVFKIVCRKTTKVATESGTLVKTLAGVFAKYIRLHLRVKNATEGTVDISGTV